MASTFAKCFIFVLAALAQTSCINTQVLSPGSCPNPTAVSDFKIDEYLGKWYSNRNYFSVLQTGQDCVTVEYTKVGGRIIVKNGGLELITRKKLTTIAKASVVSSGKLNVSFITTNVFNLGAENYWVLGTDYDSYAVGWSCLPFGIFHFKTAWILTRDQNPSDATIDAALAVFEKNGIDQKKLKLINQENCVEADKPVE
ncbi:apolipoprotein D-like [Daphnia carinata]|uniref:apolipoprotein D-like n=1 Tax=Daphnia carinata TaxID=120202 RepID=UPI00257B9641|nr:apolipoprotein D-like [Daphnia carinata]